MYADINLVTNTDKTGRNSKRVKNLRYFSFIFLFLVAVSSFLLFIINIRLSVNSVRNEQEQVINSLGNFDQTASRVIALNTRLNEIDKILQNRKEYQVIVDSVIANLSENITVSEFSIDDSEFRLIVLSTSLLQLNDFLNKTLELQSQENVESINLENLSIVQNQFTMTIVIKLR